MDIIKFICTDKQSIICDSEMVREFDAFKNYEQLNDFFGAHDKNLMCSKEEYFEGFDYTKWEDYVICVDNKIIARAGIWKYSDNEWEVAGVSTLPEYRCKGYSTILVRYCIAKILENGKIATCSTKSTNIPMIKTALKAGFKKV